jgi:hypothetical protein
MVLLLCASMGAKKKNQVFLGQVELFLFDGASDDNSRLMVVIVVDD